MTRDGFVAVGYFPKRTQPRADWVTNPAVVEICSVSECVSPGPENWIEKWLHNDLGFYASEALARQVIEGAPTGFQMYAYRVMPLTYDIGVARPWQVPCPSVVDLGDFEFLGFDIVSHSQGLNPECSPLSCNDAASEFRVNRHCLVDHLSEAHAACLAISRGEYEPGPYHLYEVHRRREVSVEASSGSRPC